MGRKNNDRAEGVKKQQTILSPLYLRLAMNRQVQIQLIRGQAQGTGDEFSGVPLDTLPSNHRTRVAAICGPCHVPATGLSIFIHYLVNSLA